MEYDQSEGVGGVGGIFSTLIAQRVSPIFCRTFPGQVASCPVPHEEGLVRFHRVLVALGFLFTFAASSFAQEASVIGTVADETKALLPGATVTATNIETGGQSVAITDAAGAYRLMRLPPVRYKLQAELTGFATVVIPSVELLVGQN